MLMIGESPICTGMYGNMVKILWYSQKKRVSKRRTQTLAQVNAPIYYDSEADSPGQAATTYYNDKITYLSEILFPDKKSDYQGLNQ